MCCFLQRQEERVADFSGHLRVPPAQGHPWSSQGTLSSLTLQALNALWQGRARGQVTPGLGWTGLCFPSSPCTPVVQPISGPRAGSVCSRQYPGSPTPSQRDVVGAALVSAQTWGAGRPQTSTCPRVPSRSEAALSRGVRFCLVLPQSLQTVGWQMETQTSFLPSCW